MSSWEKLTSPVRLDEVVGVQVTPSIEDHGHPRSPRPPWLLESRLDAERDYDRLRFAAPVRRLADKTQVFPLERNDSVRNRLTHSEEVSALARSIGLHIAHDFLPKRGVTGLERIIPASLAAVGLGHDLGNPPFGHQGEAAIRNWFEQRKTQLFGCSSEPTPGGLTDLEVRGAKEMEAAVATRPELREDFLQFEGNAQTLRLVMRLQASTNGFGLNLTAGTMAALMKYVVSSKNAEPTGPAAVKKPGFFASEASWVELVRAKVGLRPGQRHPLAYVLEACDDIAYSVVDAEDTVKKGLVSFSDLLSFLEAEAKGDEATCYVLNRAKSDHRSARAMGRLPPSELNDVSMQKFRVHAIGAMASAVMATWNQRYDDILTGRLASSLLDAGPTAALVRTLKRFDKVHAFRHRDVLAIEVEGFNKLQALMSMLWRGIVERESYEDLGSKRITPFADLAYGQISENYRREFEREDGDASLPIRYRELQLLSDAVSGMTDSFAVDLHGRLGGYHVGASFRPV